MTCISYFGKGLQFLDTRTHARYRIIINQSHCESHWKCHAFSLFNHSPPSYFDIWYSDYTYYILTFNRVSA